MRFVLVLLASLLGGLSAIPAWRAKRSWSLVELPARRVVDAGLFRAETSLPFRYFTDTFGPRDEVEKALRRLAYHSAWDEIVARLRGISSHRFVGRDEEAIRTLGFLRTRANAKPASP